MPITLSRRTNSNGINYTYEADGPADHALIPNDTYFRDLSDSLIYYKNVSGTVLSLFNELDTPTTDALIHVMPSGSDATGQRADISKPFLTLEAARTAALSGDTIIVYPGTYTPAANIAKSGVNFYFHKGAIVQRTTGVIFDNLGFAATCNVYGRGQFDLSGVDSNTHVYTFRLANQRTVFEAEVCSSVGSSSALFRLDDNTNTSVDINRINSISVGFLGYNNGFITNNVTFTAKFDDWYCNTNIMLPSARWATSSIYLSGNILQTNTGIHVADIANSVVTIVANRIVSNVSLYAVSSSSGYFDNPKISITACECIGVNFASAAGTSSCAVSGICYNILATGGCVDATYARNITCNGSTAKVKATVFQDSSGTVNVSAGMCDVSFDLPAPGLEPPGVDFLCTGGVLNIYRCSEWTLNRAGATIRRVNGGIVNLYGDLIVPNWFEGVYPGEHGIRVDSGTLNLFGSIRNQINQVGVPYAGNCIIWSGGRIISHGGKLYKTAANAAHIRATAAGLQLRVLAGGLSTNTNSGLLDGQSAIRRVAVSTDNLATQVRVTVQGSPAETFNVPVAFGTAAAIAAQLATLMNASGTLNATASHTPGDAFFLLTNDANGPTLTVDNLINASTSEIRSPGYPISEIAGGLILQSTNIE